MAKVIKYFLNNGDTPDYVIAEKDGQTSAGLWQNTDMSLVGLGDVTGTEPGVTIFNSVDALVTYLQTYMYNAKTPVFDYTNATTTWVPLDIHAAANDLWNLSQ
jgi:hypothetical protein